MDNSSEPQTASCWLLKMTTAILLFSVSGFGQSLMESQELVFPHMAIGGIWESELTLMAQGAETSSGTMIFFTQNGEAMAISVNGGTPVTSVQYSLSLRSCQTFKFTSTGETRIGWVYVGNREGRGSINGTLTYRSRVGNLVTNEVGILPSRSISSAHFPFDNTNGNKTAYALACLKTTSLVTFERYDEKGQFQDSASKSFGPWTQTARYVYELFPASSDTRGFLRITGTNPFAMVALNEIGELYSSTAILPAVFERELWITSIKDVSVYHIRLTAEGNFLTGLAEGVTPAPSINPISGSIVTTPAGKKILHLNINTFVVGTEQGSNLTLMAVVPDEGLRDVTGRAVIVYEDGSMVYAGSFRLFALPSAQF